MSMVFTTAPAFTRGKLLFLRVALLGVSHLVSESSNHILEFPIVDTQIKLAQSRLKPAVQQVLFTKASQGAQVFWQHFLSLVIGIAVVAIVVLFAPDIYYRFTQADTQPIQAWAESSVLGGLFDRGSKSEESVQTQLAEPTVNPFLPERDETLPEGTWLIIPRIGVRTPLDPTLSVEDALAKGVYISPEYGQPGDLDQPVILAAHRYGWKWWWKDDYWEYHSFYNLTKTEPGDVIEVIADKRKWIYEIYAGEEGEEITDYQADMILYTCKFLNSPVRHFRYARLVDPDRDSQGISYAINE